MAFVITDTLIAPQPIATTGTTQRHDLRTIVRAVDSTLGAGQFMYAQCSQSLAQYDAVWIKSTGKAAKLTDALARTAGNFAVAQVAFDTDEYGWFQIEGKGTVSVISGAAVGNELYTSATAGAIDDATLSTSQFNIQGIALVSGEAASVAPFIMHNVSIKKPDTSA